MSHYLIEQKSLSDLHAAFPRTPPDYPASISEYLEDKVTNGWKLHSFTDASNGFWWIFVPDAK